MQKLELTVPGNGSNDATLPPQSALAKCGPMSIAAAPKTGKEFDVPDKLAGLMETAVFRKIHEKLYKVPFGEWTKNPILREARKVNKQLFEEGVEGFAMLVPAIPEGDNFH